MISNACLRTDEIRMASRDTLQAGHTAHRSDYGTAVLARLFLVQFFSIPILRHNLIQCPYSLGDPWLPSQASRAKRRRVDILKLSGGRGDRTPCPGQSIAVYKTVPSAS